METNSEVLDQALLAALEQLSFDSSLSLLSERFPDNDCSSLTRPQLIAHLIALGANPNTVCNGPGEFEEVRSVLYMAAESGDAESVEALLSAGADTEYKCPEYNWTPLQAAAVHGKHCVFRLLVEGGADLEAGSHDSDHTPLSCAAESDSKAVMVLLELGADANPPGDSPFDLAFNGGGVETSLAHGLLGLARSHPRATILKLISWGTQNNLCGDAGSCGNPIHVAIATGLDPSLTSLLIEVGIEIDSVLGMDDIWWWLEGRNEKGWTPLMAAVAMATPNVEVIECLLSHDADVNAKTSIVHFADNVTYPPSDGRTSLHLAAERCKDPEIIRLLLENGADVMAETEDSWETPCDIGSPISSVQALLVSAELSCREELGIEDETTQFLRGWKSAFEADDPSPNSMG